jgi:hypothetical protein
LTKVIFCIILNLFQKASYVRVGVGTSAWRALPLPYKLSDCGARDFLQMQEAVPKTVALRVLERPCYKNIL